MDVPVLRSISSGSGFWDLWSWLGKFILNFWPIFKILLLRGIVHSASVPHFQLTSKSSYLLSGLLCSSIIEQNSMRSKSKAGNWNGYRWSIICRDHLSICARDRLTETIRCIHWIGCLSHWPTAKVETKSNYSEGSRALELRRNCIPTKQRTNWPDSPTDLSHRHNWHSSVRSIISYLVIYAFIYGDIQSSVHSLVHLLIEWWIQTVFLRRYLAKQNSQGIAGEIQELFKKPWFIGTLGGVLWVLFLVFSIWLYRRRRRSRGE